jgi:L-lactate dehydrogenase complex protein LldF
MKIKDFRRGARQSLRDENLQAALDNNALRRKEGRLAAIASLPDFAERRLRAHAVKAEVVAHLDETLERFVERVTANGIQVHRAPDAAEAIRIFLEIAQAETAGQKRPGEGSTPLLVAKAKSMLSEEIHFNHALEAAGMRVVETDLGEYIIQLRGERPSHIITPAVHLRRADVGRLFAEKLDLPYTEDIPTLTNAARKALREVFLSADIGVSGVNFGVAETGTLCVVTNEGNGRMCTTLPRVHVALMGIERLVRSLDELALFLSLLPRSATGQKLSVYTNLINSPLPGTGQRRHLILVDNGRRALRNSPLVESLYCIRCGACLNACPVFRETGGHAYGSIYPGPIGSVISCALVDREYASLAQASSLCGACREACPVDIDLPGMLLRVRSGLIPERAGSPEGKAARIKEGAGLPVPVRLGLKGFRLAAANPGLFDLFQGLGGLLSRLYSPRRAYMHLPAWTGWGYSKEFPRLAVRPFRRRWNEVEQEVAESGDRVNRQAEAGEDGRDQGTGSQSLAARFTEELTALGGKVYLMQMEDLPGRLRDLLNSRGIQRVLVDDAGAIYLGDVSAVREPDPAVRAGVTGALVGIAESGSLVLVSGEGQTLTASLLPEIHIAVLKVSAIVPGLEEALRRPELRTAAAGVIVTGPSRTADIEMTLTIGVHGPGELHVFLIDDSKSV